MSGHVCLRPVAIEEPAAGDVDENAAERGFAAFCRQARSPPTLATGRDGRSDPGLLSKILAETN